VPGGSFLMGSTRFDLTPPVHKVTVRSYWMGRFEVTNAEFDRYKKRPRDPDSLSERQPTPHVSWHDATAFCQWLSRKEKRRYRLPTEAEWEYAARGGLEQKDFPWGNEPPEGRAALSVRPTSAVGSFPPNHFGLYDMAGNLQEWVSDWYDRSYPMSSPRVDPKGPEMSPFKMRILRGGTLFEPYCWLRLPVFPTLRDLSIGFRVVLEPTTATTASPPASVPSGTER
jgi:formylglycine-generating enzyme